MWPPLPAKGVAGLLAPGSMAQTRPHAKRKVKRQSQVCSISSPCASTRLGHKESTTNPSTQCPCTATGREVRAKSHAKDCHKDVVCTCKARQVRQLQGLSIVVPWCQSHAKQYCTSELHLQMVAFWVVKLHSSYQGTMGLMGIYCNQNAWWPQKHVNGCWTSEFHLPWGAFLVFKLHSSWQGTKGLLELCYKQNGWWLGTTSIKPCLGNFALVHSLAFLQGCFVSL